MTHFYIVGTGLESASVFKLGFATDPAARLNQLQVGNPERLFLVSYKMKDAASFEKFVHKAFDNSHVRGEWYKLSDEDIALLHRVAANSDIECTCRGCLGDLCKVYDIEKGEFVYCEHGDKKTLCKRGCKTVV